MIYDLIIIGTGPAGMSAAIYAARRKINLLIFGKLLGGQMSWSSNIENYPAFSLLTGYELTERFIEHMKIYGTKIKEEEVIELKKEKNILYIKTTESVYEAKSVIIASGKEPRKLNVPGEEKFRGRGVNYCATCDSPFYKDKEVAVIGGGNSALDACLTLSKYATEIYLIDINKKLKAEPYLKDKVCKDKKIVYFNNSKTLEIVGEKKVTGIKFKKDNKIETLEIDGVFIEIGLVPNTSFLKGIKTNENGEVMISRCGGTNKENMTNIPGVFAAGDVTDIPSKQVIIAAGEGAKAALASFDYLNGLK